LCAAPARLSQRKRSCVCVMSTSSSTSLEDTRADERSGYSANDVNGGDQRRLSAQHQGMYTFAYRSANDECERYLTIHRLLLSIYADHSVSPARTTQQEQITSDSNQARFLTVVRPTNSVADVEISPSAAASRRPLPLANDQTPPSPAVVESDLMRDVDVRTTRFVDSCTV
jgi:hypothetical protein